MADPATQFGQAGISVPQFVPSIYHPGTVNVPTEAGSLLARIGQTALEAGRQIEASPLNPAVRSQMNYQIASNLAGIQHFKDLQSSGLGLLTTSTTPSGTTTSPLLGVTDPTLGTLISKIIMQQTGTKAEDQTTKTDGKATGTTDGQGTKEAPPKKPPTTEEQASAVQPTSRSLFASNSTTKPPAAPGFQGPSQAETTAAIAEAPTRTASADQGVPVDYQRGPQGPVAPQPQAEPGGIMDQYAQGYAQGQEYKRQQDLTNWQNTTQTEPMTADDAMKYIRRKTTLAQDATYLPHGGPNNEPAFAFHMKGGGINTIPLSQMVKDGAGPTVAAQNTSAVLSQSDRLKQQQQNALAAPPELPATDQGAQPAPQGPYGGLEGAPEAPTTGTVLSPDQQAQIAAARQPIPGLGADINVAGAGGPSLENLTAQATPEAGVRTDVTAQQPRIDPNPAPAPDLTAAQQAAVIARGAKEKDSNEFDDYGFTFHRDTDPNSKYYGKMYLSEPPTTGNYQQEQRFYMGDKGGYKLYDTLPEAAQHKEMQYWVDKGEISQKDADALDAKGMQPWLDRKWRDKNLDKTDPTGGVSRTLDAAEQFQMGQNRIKNLVTALGGPEGDSTRYNSLSKLRSAVLNAGQALFGPRSEGKDYWSDFFLGKLTDKDADTLMSFFPGLKSIPPQAASAITRLEQEIDAQKQLVKDNPGLLIPLGKGGGQEMPNIHFDVARLGSPDIPATTMLDNVWSGKPQAQILQDLDDVQTRGKQRYQEIIDNAKTMWQRRNPKHQLNIDTGLPADPTDHYKGNANLYSQTAPDRAGTAADTPKDQDAYNNLGVGQWWWNPIQNRWVQKTAPK